jgi:hypothetical protein
LDFFFKSYIFEYNHLSAVQKNQSIVRKNRSVVPKKNAVVRKIHSVQWYEKITQIFGHFLPMN